MQISIDDQVVTVEEGESILEACRRAGHGDDVPALCYLPRLPAQGVCRLCLVEVDGMPGLVAACATTVRAGMVVRLRTPAIESRRRGVLGLTAEAHPQTRRASAPGGGRCSAELAGLLARYGLAPAAPADGPLTETNGDHPYLRFRPELCVTCRRCLQVCEDVQGQFVFAIGGRGSDARLLFGEDEQFLGSGCVSCGACVEVCPTGALADIDRVASAVRQPRPEFVTRSICAYCGVGCSVDVVSDGASVTRISGTVSSTVNFGHLCAKGRYAHAWTRATDRLTQPLLRERHGFRPISWDQAISHAAAQFRRITTSQGPDAVGVMTSSRSTNESAYLFQKVFRALLGTNNVDCCARVCHASTALALRLATGTGAASASYADIEKAATIVIAGANPTAGHPVLGARLKQAARRGARLIVIDPRVIELCAYASLHLQIEPGTNVALFNALAAIILDEGLFDEAYVSARAEGFEKLRHHLAELSISGCARTCAVPVESVYEAARLLTGRGPVLFVTGLGLSELSQGTDSVLGIINLGILTGSIGHEGGGMLPLRGQNNVQGNADMGGAPNYVTGYQPLDDPAVRQRMLALWGRAPPATAGLTIPGMLAAARAGKLRGLWVQGEDLMQSDPHEAAVGAALDRLDFLVVQELFMTETARRAHLILPAAGALEQDGTFTNAERRIQRVRRAVPPPGAARPDWLVAVELGRALGADWHYDGPGGVMAEIGRLAPALFGGVSYDRLAGDGLQWPCPDAMHPGTATVHGPGFLRGRGLLSIVSQRDSPERRSGERPLLLITGRVLQHYNVGTMTRRTPNARLVDSDTLVVHPHDAAACGVTDGDHVAITSETGRAIARVRISAEMRPGNVFLSFHFPETHTNALTGDSLDPRSQCPEYKLTAVSIERVGRADQRA